MRDTCLGFGVVVIFGFVLLVLVPVGIFIPAGVQYKPLSPAFFPRIVFLLLIFLGGILIVQSIKRGHVLNKKETPSPLQCAIGEDVDSEWSGVQKVLRVGGATILLFVYYALIGLLGMVVTSVLMLPAFALLYGERRLALLVPLALILPVLLYYFFGKVALVVFPEGSLLH